MVTVDSIPLLFGNSALWAIVFFTDGDGYDELEDRPYFFVTVAKTKRCGVFAILLYWLLIPYGPTM